MLYVKYDRPSNEDMCRKKKHSGCHRAGADDQPSRSLQMNEPKLANEPAI